MAGPNQSGVNPYKRVGYHALNETVVIPCVFQPQGAGAVTTIKASRCSVARTGAGIYTVTFDAAWNLSQLVGVEMGLQMNAVTDLKLQMGAFTTVATGSTVVVSALAVGVATEIAANANNTVFLQFTFTSSSIPS